MRILFSKIRRWFRLFKRRSDTTLSIPQVDAWLANAVLGCLYDWHRRHGPGPWIVTREDLDQLAEWTRWLYAQHESTRRMAFWERYKVRNVPKQIERRW